MELNEGGNPRPFMATDQQIADISRCCTGKSGSLLQIDPTFKLGQFYLTCTTYGHPKFKNKSNDKTCLLPGPYLLHAARDTSDYAYFERHFSHALKGKSITLCDSDGEHALYSGLENWEFPEYGMAYMHDSCKGQLHDKMKELGLDEPHTNFILKDIYGIEYSHGKDGTRVICIVDSKNSEQFHQALASKGMLNLAYAL